MEHSAKVAPQPAPELPLVPEVPEVPLVPELPRPLLPVPPPAQRPDVLHGGEQQSLSIWHVSPGAAHTNVPPSITAPPSPTDAHWVSRQKLPVGQSVSMVHAPSILRLQLATTTTAEATITTAARRALTLEA